MSYKFMRISLFSALIAALSLTVAYSFERESRTLESERAQRRACTQLAEALYSLSYSLRDGCSEFEASAALALCGGMDESASPLYEFLHSLSRTSDPERLAEFAAAASDCADALCSGLSGQSLKNALERCIAPTIRLSDYAEPEDGDIVQPTSSYIDEERALSLAKELAGANAPLALLSRSGHDYIFGCKNIVVRICEGRIREYSFSRRIKQVSLSFGRMRDLAADILTELYGQTAEPRLESSSHGIYTAIFEDAQARIILRLAMDNGRLLFYSENPLTSSRN